MAIEGRCGKVRVAGSSERLGRPLASRNTSTGLAMFFRRAFAQALEHQVLAVGDGLQHLARDREAAGFGDAFQARGDVHRVRRRCGLPRR